MLREEAEALAKKVIYDRLAVRAQSRSDLAQALAKKLVPEEVAAAMLDKFQDAGLIDDEEFARGWVQSRQSSKGLSSRVLAMELRQKGVDDEISKEVLAELDPADEIQAAHRLVQGKLRSMARFKSMTGTYVVHIPYKGSAPAVVGLLAGETDVMFDNIPNLLQQIKAGKVTAIGVTGSTRSPLLPDVPTVAEAGVPGPGTPQNHHQPANASRGASHRRRLKT